MPGSRHRTSGNVDAHIGTPAFVHQWRGAAVTAADVQALGAWEQVLLKQCGDPAGGRLVRMRGGCPVVVVVLLQLLADGCRLSGSTAHDGVSITNRSRVIPPTR